MNVTVASAPEGSVNGPKDPPSQVALNTVPLHPSPNESCSDSVHASPGTRTTGTVPIVPSATLPGRPMHVMSHDTSLSHVPPPTVTFAKNEPATAGTGGGGDGDGGGVSVPLPSGGGGDGDGGGEP